MPRRRRPNMNYKTRRNDTDKNQTQQQRAQHIEHQLFRRHSVPVNLEQAIFYYNLEKKLECEQISNN